MKFFSYICNRVALDTGMCAANKEETGFLIFNRNTKSGNAPDTPNALRYATGVWLSQLHYQRGVCPIWKKKKNKPGVYHEKLPQIARVN